MSTAVQRRRGTTAQHTTFTGLNAEITVDTDKKVPVVHDGATAGGFPLLRENLSNVSAQLGFRNKIINGKMEISQRGTSFAAVGSNAYSLDRWFTTYSTSAVGTVTQSIQAPTNFQNSFLLTVTTADASVAATDSFAIRQVIEGYNIVDLVNKPFTLSFWVRSAKTGIHCVSFKNNGDDRSYVAEYTVNAANTWEYKTITVSAGLTTAGTWNYQNGRGLNIGFTLMAGTNSQTTAGAWQTGNFVATSNQVNVLDQINNIFAITGVQLEAGTAATPFEYRPYGAELALCQRYYEQSYETGVTPGTITTNGSEAIRRTGQEGATFFNAGFKVVKRATPTVIWYNTNSGASGQIYNASTGALTVTGVSTSCPTTTKKLGAPLHTAEGLAGHLILAQWTASAEL